MCGVKPRRILLLFARAPFNQTFSYQCGWPRHFATHPLFACKQINLGNQGRLRQLRTLLTARTWKGDAIVILHSVFSNGCLLDGHLFDAICRLPQPKAFFIGNEYKLMPEKMRFCEQLDVSLLVTQSNEQAVHSQYRDRLGCSVIGIPNTGLDPALFCPVIPFDDRPIDLGFRAHDSPWYVGHRERHDIAEYFVSNAVRLGLKVDISLESGRRFAEREWAGFLNRCRGQLGTESGGDYFELTDATRIAVNTYLHEHPEALFEDVHSRFFEGRPKDVPIRIFSSRNVEAAATRTVQILFEGRYDGYLQPDIHYIPLKKDFSNVDEALRKFRDRAFIDRIADNAQQLVNQELGYERLIGRFADALATVI